MTKKSAEAGHPEPRWYLLAKKLSSIPYSSRLCDPSPSTRGYWLNDLAHEPPNPYYNQTARGLFVEFYYGQPGSIHTPLGEWSCWGSGGGPGKPAEYEDWFPGCKLAEHVPLKIDKRGEHGPIYAVIEVGGEASENPCWRLHDDYIEYGESRRRWERIST